MGPVHPKTVKEVLDSALRLDEPERTALVEAVCREDPSLRTTLLQLLEGTGLAGNFLPDPPSLLALPIPPPARVAPAPFQGTVQFEILRRIGFGGSSEVFEAFDRNLRVRVALKVLRDLDPDQVDRFKRGWRSVRSLTHRNLCRIYQFIYDEGSGAWLLSMELVEGERFDLYLSAASQLLRDCFCQLAAALQALHAARICHGDVKPSNVLVTREGRVVVLDFGLSGRFDHAAFGARPVIAVTPQYAAPELFLGRPPSPASDWYSFGIILGKALTRTSTEQAADLEGLRERLLNPDPTARPDAAEVLDVLCPSKARLSPGRTDVSFVGRKEQSDRICALFREQVPAGRFALVHVRGPSGIGKTAFVEEALHRVAEFAPHLKVVAGRCYRGESVPFKAVDEIAAALASLIETLEPARAKSLLAPRAQSLSTLFPVFNRLIRELRLTPASNEQPAEPHEARRRAFSAFTRLVTELAGHFSLAIFIDDIQWGDLDSALLLRELMQAALPLLLIFAYRNESGEPAPNGIELLENDRQLSVELAPLSQEESAELALAVLGPHFRSEEASRIAADAGGNPFFVRQLAEYRKMGGESELGNIIQDRASELPAMERRSLEVLAVAQAPLGLLVLRDAAELGEDVRFVQAGLDSGCLIRSLGTADEAVLPYHDRISEAVNETIPPERRKTIHHRIASALQASGSPDVERIANHFQHAGAIHEACQFGRLAAERSMAALAFDRAAALYRDVLSWVRQEGTILSETDLGKLEAAHGNALVNCGRGIEAARAFERAIPLVPSSEKKGLRIRSVSELLRSGEIVEGIATVRSLLEEHSLPFPTTRRGAIVLFIRETVRLRYLLWRRKQSLEQVPPDTVGISGAERERLEVCWAAATGTSMVYPLRAEIYWAIYLRLALRSGERRHVALGLASYASRLAYVDDGEARPARDLLAHAKRLAELDGDPYVLAIAGAMSATIEGLNGNWKRCFEEATRSESAFRLRCIGVTWEVATVGSYLFTSRTMLGDWNENSERLSEFRAWARGRGDRYAEITISLVSAAYTHYLISDQPELAQTAIQDCLAEWPKSEEMDIQQLYAFQGLINLDLYRGDPHSAWNRVCTTWPAVQRSGLLRLTLLQTFLEDTRARAALALAAYCGGRERERLIRLAGHASRFLIGSKARYAPGLGRLLAAGIAALHNDKTRVVSNLRIAEAIFDATETIPWLAATRLAMSGYLEGSEKERARTAAMGWIKSQRIKNEERFAKMLFPAGFS